MKAADVQIGRHYDTQDGIIFIVDVVRLLDRGPGPMVRWLIEGLASGSHPEPYETLLGELAPKMSGPIPPPTFGGADYHRPSMVVSGGQTGCDQIALLAAMEHGLRIGGFAPAGFESEDGEIPMPIRGAMVEVAGDYAARTRLNAALGDGTIIFLNSSIRSASGGSRLTAECCLEIGRPCLAVPLPIPKVLSPASHIAPAILSWAEANIRAWLAQHRPRTLNVAGPRASKGGKAFGEAVAAILGEVFKRRH